ncbi:hypothetical protein LCGC14_1255600 [marine sediment metagenome]|uniref:Uncharacterized protein n=1 Tax=marine sediment metagenome TaxID=412755 RepID=A0A0F9P5M8_9ZZZZ
MNADQAVSNVENMGPRVIAEAGVLAKEVKRLRLQRELLGEEVNRLANRISEPLCGFSIGIGSILKEIDAKEQEEEQITVDQVISGVGKCCAIKARREKVLVIAFEESNT